VPAISKALPTIKRTEAFDDFLSCAVSSWMIPLACISRELVDLSSGQANCANGKPHTLENGTLQGCFYGNLETNSVCDVEILRRLATAIDSDD
jgi:hypothetical protein